MKICKASCNERVGSVCMKYAQMILRHENSNQYEQVSFGEDGIKCKKCLKDQEEALKQTDSSV